MRRCSSSTGRTLAPLAAALALSATPARAGERAALTLTRGPGAADCPDERGLADLVAARLGYEPFVTAPGTAAPRVAVAFTRAGKELRSAVRLAAPDGAVKGERTLVSTRIDCEELASTTALTISIMLDPRAGMAPRAAPPAPPAPPAPAPPADLDRALPPMSVPSPEPIRGRARLGAAASVGTTPAIGGSAILAFGVGRAWWSVDAELRAGLPASGDASGNAFSASFVGGGAVACLHGGIPYVCGGAWLGALRGEVPAASTPRQTSLHALMGPRVGVSVPLTRVLDLDAWGEVLYAPTTTTLQLGSTSLWTTPQGSIALGLGVLGRFP